MPDFKKIKESIDFVLELIFDDQTPTWVAPVLGYIFLIALLLVVILGVLSVSSKIKKLWIEEFWPLFYKPSEKRRNIRRRRFADHLESEIRRLNNLEEWQDYRFTELEAEVEAEGYRKSWNPFPIFQERRSGLRREKSLSRALELSQERLILLEGEPGSGKSVAMRYVATQMARKAMKSRNKKSLVPIYINLKELERLPDQDVDIVLIRTFVLESINRANSRDIDVFLEEEFDKGMKEGSWFFLFDSFDEIPEVLSSTDADGTIRKYADAIADFLHGMNQCRGIIASRQFRGPKQLRWPRFRILPLPEKRRLELIQKTELGKKLERELLGQLGMARQDINVMASNPMFLGLLCEYMRSSNTFPENAHSVFERYLNTRLERDQARLWRRYKLTPQQVRQASEGIAFSMAMDSNLGLNPKRHSIINALEILKIILPADPEICLNALEYLKLARSETITSAGEPKYFTFAHRRFQEYFATCVVLQEPGRVNPRELLTNGRWRETAVVIFQTQPIELVEQILEETRFLLESISTSIPNLVIDPFDFISRSEHENFNTITIKNNHNRFLWPAKTLHILSLLQDGFSSRLIELPPDIRMAACKIIISANHQGTIFDKKTSLEVAGIIPQRILKWLLKNAFASESEWLKEMAYRQASRLEKIPKDIASKIRESLFNLHISGRLHRENSATRAHLSRLDQSSRFIHVMELLKHVEKIDAIIHLGIYFLLIMNKMSLQILNNKLIVLYAFILFTSHFSMNSKLNFWIKRLKFSDVLGIFLIRISISFILVIDLLKISFLSTILSFFCFYSLLLIWGPLALLAAKAGKFLTPSWWAFLMLWPVIFCIFNPRKALYFIKSSFFWSLLMSIFVVFLVLSFGLSMFYYLLSLGGFYALVASIFAYAIIGFGFVVFLFLLMLMCLHYKRMLFDLIRWINFKNKLLYSLSIYDLFDTLSKLQSRFFSARFVRVVRQRELLELSSNTEQLLQDFSLAIEYDLLAVKSRDNEHNRHSLDTQEFMDQWLESYTKSRKNKLKDLGYEVLDEIYMLLEQLQGRREKL